MRKYYFISAILIAVLAVSALAVSDELSSGQPNPALNGIKQLYLVIEPSNGKTSSGELDWGKIETRIGQKLVKAGIDIVPGANLKKDHRERDIPELRVQMEMLKFPDSKVYVFRAQLSLATRVYLEEKKVFFKADAWKSSPVIQAASVRAVSAKVSHTILKQVEDFISAWRRANLKPSPLSDPNDAIVVTKEQSKPVVVPITVGYKYLASKNSKVFHKTDCASAKRIKPENIINYNTRTEARKAGKRPCLRCKP
ncbi:MAG: hypothetical protein KAS75_06185 [Planctomycetes bacterium]|nr:hypothetical protein [Planctomycetota bacterium]